MNKQVSAFKLFYDEFIYKNNNNVSYALIERNIDNIRDFTLDLRKTSKRDIDFYTTKLDRINKRIKEQLNEIYKINKAIYEYFYLLYKARVGICNDKVDDMPFIISCAFYEDYRLDNKSATELEDNPNAVPKYTSLEKKNIRNEAKGLSKLEYFMKIISNSDNCNDYKHFIDKLKVLLNVKPRISETHKEFFERAQSYLDECKYLFKTVINKALLNDEFEYISEMMEIAYRKKFVSWDKDLYDISLEHFDVVYKRLKDSNETRGCFNLVNDISYETFVELTNDLIAEKQEYMGLFEIGKFVPVSIVDNSYISKFKEYLINSFFDKRYINVLDENSNVQDYVERTIELYSLAEDLGNQIFERIMFDSSHSPSLRRNNDVRNAIITKIYDLYNPIYLLAIYEKTRKGFDDMLKAKNSDFIKEYSNSLNSRKIEYDFHGPVPTMSFIKTKVLERKKDFVLEHCITEMKSRDILGSYDTRNYDLDVIVKDIEISDMLDLYEKIKLKINNFDYSSLSMLNIDFKSSEFEKKEMLKVAQEFVVKDIFSKLKSDNLSEAEKNSRYKDICYGYFNEECMFVFDKEDSEVLEVDEFSKLREKFEIKSKWNKFLIANKIKNNI